ncbi:hypothetical protein DSTSK_16720 [Desulforhabdus sp. TSK]|nr:hypothetical protein [Desulforhabdus sp. TSK]GKT08367.1 hypothetical protein DSTSK_16720 [Desulforhabdus sp. TSK]
MGSVISIHMDEMLRAIRRLDPEEALEGIAGVLKVLFSTLGDEARSQFLWELMGESRNDKVSSLVHL